MKKVIYPVASQQTQDLRNCHKQWRGVAALRAEQLGDKHGNIGTF